LLYFSARDLEKQHQYTNPIQFYDFFMNRIVVAFKPRFEDQDLKQEFELTLSKKMTYDQVSTALIAISLFSVPSDLLV
jgi:ubiquitin carboxyl-terminal hydrolase 7